MSIHPESPFPKRSRQRARSTQHTLSETERWMFADSKSSCRRPLFKLTVIFVDFYSGDLSEFDALFQDLGLTHNGKGGIDALPVSLDGEGNFHGTWSGSVVDPHITGKVEATNLVIELPSSDSSAAAHTVHFDSVSATGSYSAQKINVEQGQLLQ